MQRERPLFLCSGWPRKITIIRKSNGLRCSTETLLSSRCAWIFQMQIPDPAGSLRFTTMSLLRNRSGIQIAEAALLNCGSRSAAVSVATRARSVGRGPIAESGTGDDALH